MTKSRFVAATLIASALFWAGASWQSRDSERTCREQTRVPFAECVVEATR